MNSFYTLSKTQIVLISSLCALFLTFTQSYIIIGMTVLLVIWLVHKLGQPIIIPFAIVSFLMISADYFGDYRIYVNLVITSLLLIPFLIEYGFEFDKYPKLPSGILNFIIFLIITLLVSSIFSSFKVVSLIATIRLLLFLFICYLFYSHIKNTKLINYIVYSLIIVMILSGIPIFVDLYNLGIQNYFIRGLLIEKYDLISSKGFTGVTIFFISFNLIIAQLLIKNDKNITIKISIWILLLLNFILLILANSRGGILAAIIASTVFLLILKPKIFYKGLLAFSVLFTIIFTLSSDFREAVELYLRWETISDRMVYWNMGFEIIKDNPILGVGADTFDKYFFNYSPSSNIRYFDSKLMVLGKAHPHNFFLFYFAENGILGLITALYFFGIFFYYSIITLNLSRKVNSRFIILIATIFSIGIGIFVRSFFEVTGYLLYGYITRDLPFWLLFIILLKINMQLRSIDKGMNEEIY